MVLCVISIDTSVIASLNMLNSTLGEMVQISQMGLVFVCLIVRDHLSYNCKPNQLPGQSMRDQSDTN